MNDKKIITDAYEWSCDRYIKDDPELVEFARNIKLNEEIAQQIYDIRNKLRMSREDLAEFSGLTPEDIEDLEEPDYDGSWEEAIRRVNTAFQNWFDQVIVPAAQMKPDDYSVKIMSA